MSYKLQPFVLPPGLDSKEAFTNWLQEAVRETQRARAACDIYPINMLKVSAKEQQRRSHEFLQRFGFAHGVAATLLRMRKLTPAQYDAVMQQLYQTLVPTNVGALQV